MNKLNRACAALLLALCLIPLPVWGEDAASQSGALPIAAQMRIYSDNGVEITPDQFESGHGNYVMVPAFSSSDESLVPALERINQAILEKARIPEYLQLLSALTPGGAGLRMDCSVTLCASAENGQRTVTDRYASILFSAEGKMLSGRPSQVYYPMTFDLLTGEEVTFDQMFSDPDGAKAFIEEYLEEKVEPELSTYLENSQLFPVPYDRFWLDGLGNMILYWENSQLSFLSGYSGSVAFRRSELAPWLDLTENGVIPHLSYDRYALGQSVEKQAENLWYMLQTGRLIWAASIGTGSHLSVSGRNLRVTTDSGYYPGGAYLEVEEPRYRGTLILTDDSEDYVIGLLSGNADLFQIHTGETGLADAIAFLGREPDAQIPMDDAAAEMYRVCPGTAAVYHLEPWLDGPAHVFTLFSDENGTVQYVSLILDQE